MKSQDIVDYILEIAPFEDNFGEIPRDDEFVFGIPEELHRLGAEVVIFGEVLDYTVRCCVENNMCAIETSHCFSENPGVENLAKKLKERYPELKNLFLDAGYPFNFQRFLEKPINF